MAITLEMRGRSGAGRELRNGENNEKLVLREGRMDDRSRRRLVGGSSAGPIFHDEYDSKKGRDNTHGNLGNTFTFLNFRLSSL